MSIVNLQPGSITLPDPGGIGAFVSGIPGPFDTVDFPGVTPIAGSIRTRAGDVFADSPPIADEIYLVTGFRIAYAVKLPSSSASSPTTINTQLQLLVNTDVVYTATDSENGVDINGTGVNATYIANGTFTADLVNPIAITPSDRLQIQLGTDSLGDGATLLVAVAITPLGAGAITTSLAPSTISYQLLNRTAQ